MKQFIRIGRVKITPDFVIDELKADPNNNVEDIEALCVEINSTEYSYSSLAIPVGDNGDWRVRLAADSRVMDTVLKSTQKRAFDSILPAGVRWIDSTNRTLLLERPACTINLVDTPNQQDGAITKNDFRVSLPWTYWICNFPFLRNGTVEAYASPAQIQSMDSPLYQFQVDLVDKATNQIDIQNHLGLHPYFALLTTTHKKQSWAHYADKDITEVLDINNFTALEGMTLYNRLRDIEQVNIREAFANNIDEQGAVNLFAQIYQSFAVD